MSTNSEEANGAKLWNSLEVCKLIVGLMVPITIVLVSNQFATRERLQAEKLESKQKIDDSTRAKEDERERREVDRRFSVWEEMSPDINQIYSYFLYVGDWKAIRPEEVIQKKRHLDDLIYSNRIFFNNQFFDSYTAFTKAAFDTYQGWDEDPKLNTVRIRDLDIKSKVQFANCDNGEKVYLAYWRSKMHRDLSLICPR